MKEKYPGFPHCSITSNKVWEQELMEIPETTLKKLIHPISETVRKHYPYFAMVNRDERTVFFCNRDYKKLEEHKNTDSIICEYKMMELPENKGKIRTFDDNTGEVFYFYDDMTNPTTDEKCWIDYWVKVLDFCKKIKGVPVFVRYQMWSTKELYTLAAKINKMSKEIEVLKQYKEACKKSQK